MKIEVCTWKSCKANFCEYILKRLNSDKEKFNYKNVVIEEWMCMWMCSKWPNVKIDWDIMNYCQPAKVAEIAAHKK